MSTLLALLSSAALVAAHGDGDMAMPGMGDMPEGSHGEAMSMGMMMWFHFTRGDNLLFKQWAPKAAGAFAGACIALVVLAMVDRFLAAIRAAAEAKWAYQAQHDVPITSSTYNDFSPAPLTSTANKDAASTAAADVPPRVRDVFHTRGPSPGWVQPRKVGRDALRGLLHGVQGGLGLTLMLAVMSFNVWFLLSVVVGLALGEFAFGRFSASHARQGGASGAQCC